MRIQGKLGVACEIYNILQKEELTMRQKAAVSIPFVLLLFLPIFCFSFCFYFYFCYYLCILFLLFDV